MEDTGYPLSPFCVNLWWHQLPQSFLSSMCLFWQIIPRGAPDFRHSRVISFITEESCSGKAEINHTDTGCGFLSQDSSFQPEAPDGNFGHGAHPSALSRRVEHPRYAAWGRAPGNIRNGPFWKTSWNSWPTVIIHERSWDWKSEPVAPALVWLLLWRLTDDYPCCFLCLTSLCSSRILLFCRCFSYNNNRGLNYVPAYVRYSTV